MRFSPLRATAMLAAIAATFASPGKTVHVVQTCHLDIGFADTAVGILNRYHVYLLQAASISADLHSNPGKNGEGLIFTTHSYVVSLLFDCNAGFGYMCFNEVEKSIVSAAIKRGHIVMQAFPFNAETATLSKTLFLASLNLTNSLTDRFGVPRSAVMTQRDVPGATRGVVPLLAGNGVEGFSIGVNTASLPPALPRAFLWVDNATKTDLMTTVHPHGYGGIGKIDCIDLDGLDHILCPDYKGDNSGPWGRADIEQHWAQLRKEFPDAARIIPSSYDAFFIELKAVKETLPRFTGEMGDTWIYGVPRYSPPLAIGIPFESPSNPLLTPF